MNSGIDELIKKIRREEVRKMREDTKKPVGGATSRYMEVKGSAQTLCVIECPCCGKKLKFTETKVIYAESTEPNEQGLAWTQGGSKMEYGLAPSSLSSDCE